MRFEVLGPLCVIDEGIRIDLGGPRQRGVLAVLLAASPDDVSADRLVDEVWGDGAPGTASHVVRTYVSNLKSMLHDRIASDGHRYHIAIEGDESDAAELTAALREARSLLETDPAAAFDRADAVIGLRRGRPFEDAAEDAFLVRARAEALEEQYLQVVEVRLDAALRLGRQDEVLPDLEALVRLHPFRERLAAQLMLALYRSGRQAEALGEYRSVRTRLVEELGIDPSPDLQHLEERILLQDPALALRPPHNLPTPVSSFVGRLSELGEVIESLDGSRLISLIGVGGVGKTRLAREAALARLGSFPDGIWWIDLAPLADAESIVPRVAEVLGVSGQPGLPLEAVVRRYLSARSTLLVFDNCEHLGAAAGVVIATVLDAGPGVKVLATSRRPLGLAGEVRCPVPPMSLPDASDSAAGLGASDAEQLFLARAGDAAPSMTIDAGAIESVARICLRLDGIPLAIEMAAARTRVLSPGQIAQRLEQGSGFLGAEDVDRHARQHTIEGVIGWSYDLLDRRDRLVFDRISVFTGAFDLEAAEAIAGFDPITGAEVLHAIAGLAESSMLSTVHADHIVRYRLLQTLREFAAKRLRRSGAAAEVDRRHARYHLDLAVDAGRYRMTPKFAEAMTSLDAVRDDLVAALDWSLEHEPDRTIEAAPGLAEYWIRRGDPALAYDYGKRMLDRAPDASPALRAAALLCASFGAALSGDFELAARGPAEALELAGDDAGWQTRLWALHGRGQISTILGDLDTVERMGRAILDLCEAEHLDLPRAYGLCLLGLAEFFGDRDYAAARRYLDDAIAGFRRLQDYGGLKIYGLATAGPVAALQGDFDAAERYATEAIALPGEAWTAAAYITWGGYALLPQLELERARLVLQRGTRLAYETSTEIWLRTGLLFLARLAADMERWELAARLFGACRPNLPAWGNQPRWWTSEPLVRSALGDAAYERLVADGATTPLDEVLGWIDEGLR